MGKIIKHTEYYCDICGDKIQFYIMPFSKYYFYKIKCYDYEGNREKIFDYSYVCSVCMRDLITKIKKRKENKND